MVDVLQVQMTVLSANIKPSVRGDKERRTAAGPAPGPYREAHSR